MVAVYENGFIWVEASRILLIGEPFCLDGALDEQMSHGQLSSIWNEKEPDNEMGVEH